MDYEKKYKEALSTARRLYNMRGDWTNLEIESIFPELRESEDEKVRKEIINYISTADDKELIPHESWIAWLEKQGNKDMGISEATKQELEDNLHKALEKETSESWNKFLEGEQMSADNIEPKFNIGDWLINPRTSHIIHIKHVLIYDNKGIYELENSSMPIKNVEDNFRLWTIQDAKDGDVLYCRCSDIEYIVMSMGVNENGNIDSYFRYNSLDGFGVDIPAVLSTKYDDIIPATKEQRDLLFAKMKESGYKWDAEKKELKKIEENSGGLSEEDENNIQFLTGVIEEAFKDKGEMTLYGTDVCAHVTKEDVLERLNSLRHKNV